MGISIEYATRRLKEGEVVAFPTETFFGLGADPRNERAVEALLELKGRALAEGVPLIIDNEKRLQEILASEPDAVTTLRAKLTKHFWPGPLTVVVAVNANAAASFSKGIFGPEQSLAVRVSPLPAARELAAGAGGFITATSANPHGLAPPKTAAEAQNYFPALQVVDEKTGDAEKPSTIVDTRKIPFVVLRHGAIESSALQSFLQ